MKQNVIMIFLTITSLALFAQNQNSRYSEMYDSIIANDLETHSFLIEKTENINLIEYDGHYLFESIFVNCEAAEMLLAAGLDLSYKNKDGITIKEMILESNNKKLLSLMERY